MIAATTVRPMSLAGLTTLTILCTTIACAGAALTMWAATAAGLDGAVAVAGPGLVVPGGLAVIATWHRRELVAERDAADLAAANNRERM